MLKYDLCGKIEVPCMFAFEPNIRVREMSHESMSQGDFKQK